MIVSTRSAITNPCVFSTMAATARIVPKIYLIGDSNTQNSLDGGFSTKLAVEYARRCDVINRGYGGYTSKHLCLMIPKMLENDNQPKGSIHTATIMLGSNDANLPPESRHVPLDVYKNNLEFIISSLKDQNVENIIMISPPPCDDKKWAEFLLQSYGVTDCTLSNAVVSQYAEVCSKVAKQENLCFLNIYEDMMKLPNWQSNFYDGLHLNSGGNNYVFYKLKELLDPLIPQQMVYPDWKEINHQQPHLSLL